MPNCNVGLYGGMQEIQPEVSWRMPEQDAKLSLG